MPFERYHRRLKLKLIKKELAPINSKCLPFEHLSDSEQQRLIPFVNTREEFITRSAIEIADWDDMFNVLAIYSVASPGHHAEVITYANSIEGTQIHNLESVIITQGFITSTGRFVEREEAFIIANKAQQVVVKHGNKKLLFSEDMWSLTGEEESFRKLYLHHWTNKVIDLIYKIK